MVERDSFITENLGLVHACCHRFKGRGIEYDDLYQAGCVGLIKAADRFDEGRGICFSTYAVPAILGEIKRLFRDGGTVKVSRSLKELSMRAARQGEQLQKTLGREPTVNELAEALGVSPEEAAEALCAGRQPLSLTVSDEEDGRSEFDVPTDDGQEKICDTIALDDAVSQLDERDKKIIYLRYFQTNTQNQTAQKLGMTQVQVSRREKVILTEIRRRMQG